MMVIVSRIVKALHAVAMSCLCGVQHEATLRAAVLLSARNQQVQSLKKCWEVGIRIEPTPNPG